MTNQLSITGINVNVEAATQGIVQLGTGFANACMSDDVNFMTVEACARLQLPICLKTCMKMERLAKRKHRSKIMSYIGLTVGYAPNDVADQLASNNNGVRFLGLAAALLSLKSTFDAAQALHHLISLLPPPSHLRLPTVKALKDLLVVLESKLSASGFAEQIIGWEAFLRSPDSGLRSLFIKPIQQSDSEEELGDDSRTHTIQESNAPSAENIAHLLESLSAIDTGEASHVVIQAPAALAVWILTFIRWCSDEFPSVQVHGRGSNDSVLEQPNSRFRIHITTYPSQHLNIKTYRESFSIENLICDDKLGQWSNRQCRGMVKATQYFRARVRDLQDEYSEKCEVDIPSTLLMMAVVLTPHLCAHRDPEDGTIGYVRHATGGVDRIVRLLQLTFDIPDAGNKSSLVKEYQERKFSPIDYRWHVRQKSLSVEMSKLFLEILLLSTFESYLEGDAPDIFVERGAKVYANFSKELRTMQKFLHGRTIGDQDWHEWSQLTTLSPVPHHRSMIGLHPRDVHDALIEFITGVKADASEYRKEDRGSKTLITSYKGQVFYPKVLETLNPEIEDVPFTFRILPGVLYFNEIRYKSVAAEDSTQFPKDVINVKDASSDPPPMLIESHKADKTTPTWLWTDEDDHLSIVLRPYSSDPPLISPKLFYWALSCPMWLKGCQDNESTHSDAISEPGVIHCRSVNHALMDHADISERIRVLSCRKGSSDMLCTLCELAHIYFSSFMRGHFPQPAFFTAVKGTSCMSCAYRMVSQLLKDFRANPSTARFAMNIILVAEF